VLREVAVVPDLCDEVAGALLIAEDVDLRFRSPLCEAADPEVLLFCTAEDDLRDSPLCAAFVLPELRELVADELLLWLSDDAAGRAEVLREP